MNSLAEELNLKAAAAGVPLAVQLDLTYRCNERCIHCYLDHDDKGEMTFAEIDRVLTEMAVAGVFHLTLSGGEPLLRKDFFSIVRRARELSFNVKLKTNAILIGEREADTLRELAIDGIQISIYSNRAEVHDAITKVHGSLARSLNAARFLIGQELRVNLANVLMKQNAGDYRAVQALADEIGAGFILDPTITPHLNSERSLLGLNISREDLGKVLRDVRIRGNTGDFCSPASAPNEAELDGFPCSAGHTTCYISPYGEVYPCVQFPLPSGNVRRQSFIDIWRESSQLEEVRSIRLRDLPVCASCVHATSCTRCPGLAYMEGNMRGPSLADCAKSFARTGIETAGVRATNQLIFNLHR